MKMIAKLLATAPGSIKGQIDLTELTKAIGTAISGSTLVGLLILVLTAVSASATAIFPNPTTASLAVFGIGLVVDLLRRQSQGVRPIEVRPGNIIGKFGSYVPRPDPAVLPMDDFASSARHDLPSHPPGETR